MRRPRKAAVHRLGARPGGPWGAPRPSTATRRRDGYRAGGVAFPLPALAVEVTFPLTIDYGVVRAAVRKHLGEEAVARSSSGAPRWLRDVRRPQSRPGADRRADRLTGPATATAGLPSWAGASRLSRGLDRPRSDPTRARPRLAAPLPGCRLQALQRRGPAGDGGDAALVRDPGLERGRARDVQLRSPGRPSRKCRACSGPSARPPAASRWRSRPSGPASWRWSRTPCASEWPSTSLRYRPCPAPRAR